MKNSTLVFCLSLCALLLASCGNPAEPANTEITLPSAVIEIAETSRSQMTTAEATSDAVTGTAEINIDDYLGITEGVTYETTAPPEIQIPPSDTTTEKKFTITFLSPDGVEIEKLSVSKGEQIAEPTEKAAALAAEKNLIFVGWDAPFDSKADHVVTAIFKSEYYTVKFLDFDGSVLKTITVKYGEDAPPPDEPVRDGYVFDGWNGNWRGVSDNLEIYATYFSKETDDMIRFEDFGNFAGAKYEDLDDGYTNIIDTPLSLGNSKYLRTVFGYFDVVYDVSELDINEFVGNLILTKNSISIDEEHKLLVYIDLEIYCDDVQKYSGRVSIVDNKASFAINVSDAKSVRVKMRPSLESGVVYTSDYKTVIGGLADSYFYLNK